MFIRWFVFLWLVGFNFGFDGPKEAFLHFEMGNYFLKGQDWKNALKFYEKAEGNLGFADLDIVLCRNLATVHLMLENKGKSLVTLGRCIQKIPYPKIENSQPLREVYQMYAQLKADEINPKILNLRRNMVRERAEAYRKQEKTTTGPKFGFQKK
ncbi:hypothetical protein HOF92_08775 [bacterium]|jgi:hypothetical protein|nr:hypothetical protein [bacterium]